MNTAASRSARSGSSVIFQPRRLRASATRRDGEPDRRVVGRIEFDDPERFDALIVKRVNEAS